MVNLIDRTCFNEFLECLEISEKDFANKIGIIALDDLTDVYLHRIVVKCKDKHIDLGNLVNLKGDRPEQYTGILVPHIFQGLRNNPETELTFNLKTHKIHKTYRYLKSLIEHTIEGLFVDLLIHVNAYGLDQIILIEHVLYTGNSDITIPNDDTVCNYSVFFKVYDDSKVTIENG